MKAPVSLTRAVQLRRRNDWPGRTLGLAFWLPLAWILLVVAVAFVLPVADPLKANFLNPVAPPSFEHLLGTDILGRDVLARIAHGARVSLILAVLAPLVGFSIALPLGLLAGYFRGPVDACISILNDTVLAFPRIILAIGVIFYAGATIANLTFIIAFFTIPNLLRITRSTTIAFANREFILAARVLGASHLRVLVKDLLPNVLVPSASYALLAMSAVVILEGILSFLGISIPPPTPTWGRMIAEGFEYIYTEPQITLVPSAAMFLTVLSFNLIGDRLALASNVKESGL